MPTVPIGRAPIRSPSPTPTNESATRQTDSPTPVNETSTKGNFNEKIPFLIFNPPTFF